MSVQRRLSFGLTEPITLVLTAANVLCTALKGVYQRMRWVFICHGWQITSGKLRADNFFTVFLQL